MLHRPSSLFVEGYLGHIATEHFLHLWFFSGFTLNGLMSSLLLLLL